MSSLKSKIVSGFSWKLIERSGVSISNFIISILLARALMPADYGIVAMAMVFINIINSLIQSGFNTALVQKKILSSDDSSSAFYCMIILSFFFYIILYFSAPFISESFRMPLLTSIIRFMGIFLIIGTVSSILNALVMRQMLFKASMLANFSGIILSGTVGIYMAIHGYGAWSLIISQLINLVVVCIVMQIFVKWRLKFVFLIKSVKDIWQIGAPLLASELTTIIHNNIYTLIIGKMYNPTSLGLYYRGINTPTALIDGAMNAGSTVILPALSSLQDDYEQVKHALQKFSNIFMFVMFLLILGLEAISRDFVAVILGEKWVACTIYMELGCIMLLFYPLRVKMQALKAIGYGKDAWHSSLLRSAIGISLLFATAGINLQMILISAIVTEFLYTIYCAYLVKKRLNYSFTEQFRDISDGLIVSIIMCVGVNLLNLLFTTPSLISLLVKIVSIIFIIIFISYIFKPKSYLEIIKIIKPLIKKQ